MIAEFANASMDVITGIFSSPQPIECAPFQDEVFADDPRYKVWYDVQHQLGTMLNGLPAPAAP